MNTIYDFNYIQNEEMLWAEISSSIIDFERGISQYMVKSLVEGNLTKDEAIIGFGSIVILKIVGNCISVNYPKIASERIEPITNQNQARRYKPRRKPSQNRGFFALENIFTLKGN